MQNSPNLTCSTPVEFSLVIPLVFVSDFFLVLSIISVAVVFLFLTAIVLFVTRFLGFVAIALPVSTRAFIIPRISSASRFLFIIIVFQRRSFNELSTFEPIEIRLDESTLDSDLMLNSLLFSDLRFKD